VVEDLWHPRDSRHHLIHAFHTLEYGLQAPTTRFEPEFLKILNQERNVQKSRAGK
jgi:hypothetical protein